MGGHRLPIYVYMGILYNLPFLPAYIQAATVYIQQLPKFPQFSTPSQKPEAESHTTCAEWLGSCWKTNPSDSSPESSCLAPEQSRANTRLRKKAEQSEAEWEFPEPNWKKWSLVEWHRAKCKIVWSQAEPTYVKLETL
jgi:hypothetical protein